MPKLTADMVRPLVAEMDASEGRLLVTFKDPVVGRTVDSWATIGRPALGRNAAGGGLWGRARMKLSAIVGKVVGGGAQDDAASGDPDVWAELGAEERALVDAFRRVSSEFEWDPTDKRYVCATLMSDLQTELWHMLHGVRIAEPADRKVLARMLAEIAGADGTIADAERAFFASFAGTDAGSIDELLVRARLTREELTDTTPALREAMLAIAYALAYMDADFADTERQRLDTLARDLGIPAGRERDLMRMAREYVVDQMFESIYEDGEQDADERRQVGRLAAGIGVTPDVLERLDERCRKRKGIA